MIEMNDKIWIDASSADFRRALERYRAELNEKGMDLCFVSAAWEAKHGEAETFADLVQQLIDELNERGSPQSWPNLVRQLNEELMALGTRETRQ
jgi:hypothetical protein